MIDGVFILVGFLMHQTRHPLDAYPRMFPAGWRELVAYTIGSWCIHELFPVMAVRYGLSKDQAAVAKHAHLSTLVMFGIGTALGWVFDGWRNSH